MNKKIKVFVAMSGGVNPALKKALLTLAIASRRLSIDAFLRFDF